MKRRKCFYSGFIHVAVIFTILLAVQSSAFAGVPIKIFQNNYWELNNPVENKIKEIINNNLEISEELYHRVGVKTLFQDSGAPEHLIAYLLRKDTYSYETVKINLNNNYEVLSVIMNYVEQSADYSQSSTDVYASCPDNTVQMVFSTCETGIPTAVSGINKAVEIAENAGYKTVQLTGSQENTTAIKNWLSCDSLIMWGRIGHGSTSAIILDDAELTSSYFNGLTSTDLNDKALYFNSCDVHNSPLEPAIVDAGVQKFVGGDVELMIGPSEEVFKCWMDKVITDGASMTSSLPACEQENNYPFGDHAISGNGSDYLSSTPDPDPGIADLTNGQTLTNLSASQGDWMHYRINVPSGSSNLEMIISGGTGDADLYTRFGSQPALTSYDCRPYEKGNEEVCSVATPEAGNYYIGIYGYNDISALSLTAGYEGGQPDPDPNPDPINYCESSGGDQSYEYIGQVAVDSLSNSSDASPYSDFTSETVDLMKDTSYSITLTPEYKGGSYIEYWKIWIDLNHDGDFNDTGETLLEDSGVSAVTSSLTIPASATAGNTRLRISMSYSGYPDSCDTFSYGEVEDYTVTIQ